MTPGTGVSDSAPIDRPARRRRPWAVAGCFGVAWLLVLLAGSDRPPPPGFAIVLVILLVLVVVIAVTIPRLWQVQGTKGARHVYALCTVLGALAGLLIALGFASGGSGEPSRPDMSLLDTGIWLSVLTVVGAVNGALVAAVTTLTRPTTR